MTLKLYSIAEAAEQVGISAKRLAAAVNAGKVPYFPRGSKRHRRVTINDVETWISSEFSTPKTKPPIDDAKRKLVFEQLGLRV